MSRVGKEPIEIPSGVNVEVVGRLVKVAGPKGNLEREMPMDVTAKVADNMITFTPKRDVARLYPIWGTARALVATMVEGVNKGFSIQMKLIGVGYRAQMQGSKLNMSLGYSHPIVLDVPQGISVEVSKDQTDVTITGIDKQVVGEFAAQVRNKRLPEPFKGKGVRYANEYIAMKEGKKK